MFTSLVLIMSFIMISPSLVQAQEYYADIQIDVLEDGSLNIKGITNDPDFSSGIHQEFTSKKGIYWFINISSEKKFSDYIISIKLPEGSEFNYLKTDGRSRISYDKGIRIVASGSNSLNIALQYHVNKKAGSTIFFWTIIIFVILSICGFILWKYVFRKNKRNHLKELNKYQTLKIKSKENAKINSKKEIVNEHKVLVDKTTNANILIANENKLNEKLNILKQTLSENQVKILELLLAEGGSLTQKQLQHRSGIPKATLSRNVEILAKKNVVKKQSRGLTNMIMFNKELVE